ncbi:hypothetical protein BJ165DRAFT_1426587 [Panaeolus papilionaceus]|nr:hypothetical protein BJ165DRAFT_1426587 [Panaeolus papilionaceus]
MTRPPPDFRENAEAWHALLEMVKNHVALYGRWRDKLQNMMRFTQRFVLFAVIPFTIFMNLQHFINYQRIRHSATIVFLAENGGHLTASGKSFDTSTLLKSIQTEKHGANSDVAFLCFTVSAVLGISSALLALCTLHLITSRRFMLPLSMYSAQEHLAYQQRQYQNMLDWNVPLRVLVPPVITFVSVLFFFVGLINLLMVSSFNVVAVSSAYAALVLVFLVRTTITSTRR